MVLFLHDGPLDGTIHELTGFIRPVSVELVNGQNLCRYDVSVIDEEQAYFVAEIPKE